jgi:hypothetical protein
LLRRCCNQNRFAPGEKRKCYGSSRKTLPQNQKIGTFSRHSAAKMLCFLKFYRHQKGFEKKPFLQCCILPKIAMQKI